MDAVASRWAEAFEVLHSWRWLGNSCIYLCKYESLFKQYIDLCESLIEMLFRSLRRVQFPAHQHVSSDNRQSLSTLHQVVWGQTHIPYLGKIIHSGTKCHFLAIP